MSAIVLGFPLNLDCFLCSDLRSKEVKQSTKALDYVTREAKEHIPKFVSLFVL